jgi:anaerobic selenocysteine-containing dehydrogenase
MVSTVTEIPAKIVRTMCPMNCHPTLCGMLAEVRDGRLVGVKGDEANPDSQGFLCVRGQASREVIDNPARLLHPLMRDRRSDEFRRVTWNEAFERIAAGMDDPAAVGDNGARALLSALCVDNNSNYYFGPRSPSWRSLSALFARARPSPAS